MHPFVCELLARRPGGEIDLEESRVFIAPSLAGAVDQARHWVSMEPWIEAPGSMLRLISEGRPVWTQGLGRPVLV